MKRKLIIVGILSLLLSTCIATGIPILKHSDINPVNRGVFYAELGVRDERGALLTLEGNYRDFRGGHILSGKVNDIDSDRSIRFQGFATRNRFLIQTTVRGSIVNIVGRFNSYDENTHEFSGIWEGIIVGQGRTRGWITAQFN